MRKLFTSGRHYFNQPHNIYFVSNTYHATPDCGDALCAYTWLGLGATHRESADYLAPAARALRDGRGWDLSPGQARCSFPMPSGLVRPGKRAGAGNGVNESRQECIMIIMRSWFTILTEWHLIIAHHRQCIVFAESAGTG